MWFTQLYWWLTSSYRRAGEEESITAQITKRSLHCTIIQPMLLHVIHKDILMFSNGLLKPSYIITILCVSKLIEKLFLAKSLDEAERMLAPRVLSRAEERKQCYPLYSPIHWISWEQTRRKIWLPFSDHSFASKCSWIIFWKILFRI